MYSRLKEWIHSKIDPQFIFSMMLATLVNYQMVISVPVTTVSKERETEMVMSTSAPSTPEMLKEKEKELEDSNWSTDENIENQGYFEGDLAISKELIQAYYGDDSSGNEVIILIIIMYVDSCNPIGPLILGIQCLLYMILWKSIMPTCTNHFQG